VERTAVLIHLVDATQADVAGAWRTVRAELAAYGEGLEGKPELLALNKVDALDEATRTEAAEALEAAAGVSPKLVSGVSGEGVTELLREAWRLVRRERGEAAGDDDEAEPRSEGWAP
jgi:GTP-binding protein